MRTLNKNKQKLWYSLFNKQIPIYDYYEDSEGNRIQIDTGETRLVYDEPVSFFGNIAFSGGETEGVEYGIDTSQYSAVLVVDKGMLPIDETSLIWHDTEPKYDSENNVDGSSADYKVVKITPSLNSIRYVLERVVK